MVGNFVEKMREKKLGRRMLLLLICLACLFSLGSFLRRDTLELITENKQITVLTVNSPNCYYMYRDRPMGFEYDLVKAFSEYLGVQLKVTTSGWEELLPKLRKGKGDLIAANLAFSDSQAALVDFSDDYLTVEHQVIVHKENGDIRKLEDLQGRVVHVRRGSRYEDTLEELKSKNFDIRIERYEEISTDELIRMVADKEIDITIADFHIALLNRRYTPDIRIAFPIGRPQSLAWVVRKGEKSLLLRINEFMRKIKEDGTFERIYGKYFGNIETFDYVDLKRFHERVEGRLPKYRGIIEKAAAQYGFDWRLIAAMVYQESQFDPGATSFTGVEGIMQLTQVTASDMQVQDRRSVEDGVLGGVRYLRDLYNRFDDAGNPDRMYLALASYNVGRGHVTDAQRIAIERGLDPNSWSAIEEVLPLLGYRKHYKKTAYGYCRGTEPVRYVNRIRTYYDILMRDAIS